MKERQRQMLRYMLINRDLILIDHLAETFSIGRRTVSRDLDILDKWLSIRGSRLERKQNHGIRVLGFSNSLENLLDLLNKPTTHLETISPAQRQKHILIYMLYHNREIKITELAGTFFISDTSVWNDLNQIEKNIQHLDFKIVRLKGVGIRLTGSEIAIRLYFLTTLTEAFTSNTIIPYLYQVKESSNSSLEVNQFRLLMKRMNIPESNSRMTDLIKDLNLNLGYHFTMSGEALLYFYFQLTLHRIKSGAIISEEVNNNCIKKFHKISEKTLNKLVGNVYIGIIPEEEVKILGIFLQILEIGDLGSVRTEDFKDIISKPIKKLTQNMIKEFSTIDNRMYYLNEHIEAVINMALATLILRLNYKVPYWHGEWGHSANEEWNNEKKEVALIILIKKHFGLDVEKRDLENILLHFHSLILNKNDIPEHKLRTVVCCFEGIGLASYLQTVLQRDLKNIKIVEATAVNKIDQEYIDKNGIELIISTYPLNMSVPVIPIKLPLNKEILLDEINNSINNLKDQNPPFREIIETKSINIKETMSFDLVINFIQSFNMFTFEMMDDHNDIIKELSNRITQTNEDYEELSNSFKKREDIGPLFFEEYGIRVLHCKSTSTEIPKAGILKFNDSKTPRMIYMVAPDPCPDVYRKLLSTITISFLENKLFRQSVIGQEMNQIRKNLMDIYKDLI
ncbi:MAG: HTH domain-containing protein [Spirochaetaceae bacterium]